MGIKCPRCGTGDCGVRDSRRSGDMIRRRRACPRCDVRFTTFEIVSDGVTAVGTFYSAQLLRGQLSELPDKPRHLIEALIKVLAQDTAAREPEDHREQKVVTT